jgi:hypothetical protein
VLLTCELRLFDVVHDSFDFTLQSVTEPDKSTTYVIPELWGENAEQDD